MKQVYLVGRINDNGCFTGSLFAYSSMKKAIEAKDYFNDLFNSSSFIIEPHFIH